MDGLKAFFDKPRLWLNALLFGLTVVSTFAVGLGWSLSYVYAERLASDPPPALTAETLRDPRVLGLSALYVAALMAILLAHEFGHYLTCRRFGIDATLPFFLPAPSLIGTMGAFIRIRGAVTRRRQLFDIGAAGPLAGFVLAVPALAWGLARSRVVAAIPSGDAIIFGEPLLLKAFGAVLLKDVGPGRDIILHPVAFAGWVGILVTALNLMPLGQLDGGHIVYAALGRRHRAVVYSFLGVMVVLFLASGWYGWLIWIGMAIALGLRHPPPMDDLTPLDRGRWVMAGVALVLLIMLTTPLPLYEF